MFDRYSIGEIINVHGLLNDNPILGVNDVTQIGNEQYRSDYELVQMLVKSEIDKKISKGWREQACNIINKTDAIYVFGMSLGDTDLFWWQSIAKWLEEDEAHLLKVHCHKESDTQRMIEKKEQIYNKFASHCQKNGYAPNIIIDEKERTMKVTFARVSSNVEVKTFSNVKMHVISANANNKI